MCVKTRVRRAPWGSRWSRVVRVGPVWSVAARMEVPVELNPMSLGSAPELEALERGDAFDTFLCATHHQISSYGNIHSCKSSCLGIFGP